MVKEADKIIEEVFSTIDFARYSVREKDFLKFARNSQEVDEISRRLETLRQQGMVNYAEGFYTLTKQGRDRYQGRIN